MGSQNAQFYVGQVIHHKLFDYRGVIVDVDPNFQYSDSWYKVMANTKPSKEQPWYHILVHNTDYMTYVAEQNLEADQEDNPINHPAINSFLQVDNEGHYQSKRKNN